MNKNTLVVRGQLMVWNKKLNKYIKKQQQKIENPPLDFIYEKYPKYRMLGLHEKIEEGDEYYTTVGWFKSRLIGCVVGKSSGMGWKYRRRIKK
jgi:hypothetical protein